MNKLQNIKFKKEYFLFLLPLFFVLHGYVENRVSINPIDALVLFLKYSLCCLILSVAFYFYTKDFRKAIIISFSLTVINFFSGSFRELLKEETGLVFLIKYSVFLPIIFLSCLTVIVLVKNSKKDHDRLTKYLNILFTVLCFFEVFQLGIQQPWKKQSLAKGYIHCKTCLKPDIFLIIADEYAGEKQLTEEFNFNNSEFFNALESRGFFILKDPSSNYNQSMYSVASMFKMNYLDGIEKKGSSKKDINYCFNTINKNAFTDFLTESGYEIKNFSIFPFANQYSPVKQTFIYTGINLITHQTLFSRIEKDIGFNLVTKYKFNPVVKKMTKAYYSKQENNEELVNKLLGELNDNKTTRPKFVYTHLLMPHYPFYFDKSGNPYPVAFELPSDVEFKRRYIEYLQYCNKRFLNIIDLIQKKSTRPYVIIFMSDHGLRLDTRPEKIKYHFMNINSVYFPNKKYQNFYTGMSNVNQFRVLLNNVFQQNLPMLKDSTIFFD